uniref:Protein kinase domain-containing protein n=1 Tax=Daucus carota subsp. sativus TaxID=79200 RepID=A0A161ZLZ7_DAUCS|nr:PREDICTED: receptor-like protein kinase FERONIA [Daucus carota subsp. sativus]
MLLTSFSWQTCHFVACFFIITTLSWSPDAASPSYDPPDNIRLNCGSTKFFTTSRDGIQWVSDSTTSPDIFETSTTSTANEQSPSVDKTPYSTARFFRSQFTYTIRVSEAGQHFLRLYFYPANYSNGLKEAMSFFTVNMSDHTLLSKLSAFVNLRSSSSTLVKEFIITVDQNRLLELTFIPSPNSYAFVNGIEVVSIPNNLYIKGSDDITAGIRMVGQRNEVFINESKPIEKLYRLNVGGGEISSTNDTGMFRSWDSDEPYLLGSSLVATPNPRIPIKYTAVAPPYTAPEIVYNSARLLPHKSHNTNLTWVFPVDSGFLYLLRLHFCDVLMEIYDFNQLVFDILINNQTAEEYVDVYYLTGGIGIPVYKDYVVFVGKNQDGSKSKPYLWLAMHPNMKNLSVYDNVILNGLEIFKLNPQGGTFAAPNPKSEHINNKSGASQSALIGASQSALIGGSIGGIILFTMVVGLLLYRRRRAKSQDDKSRSTTGINSSLPSVRSQKFCLEEVKLATSNFDQNFVIGTGGFGNVYRGFMKDSTYAVAIKRLNPSSRQGAHEFHTEITILSNLRHRHLVPLIGCCDDSSEMILVYDYMVHGTLRDHLYGADNPPLSWKQRLQICIGAARGLHYLHAGAERVIIHRDVKSTNILLDEKMVAKVSDFGLSKMGPSDASVTHMSTVVKGSFGYLDPEYYLRRQLTTKSDVYSFGVVLFEVLCARPEIMQDLPYEQMNLAEWSRNCYRNGLLGEIVDKNVAGEITVESLNKFGEVGYSCLRDHGIDRPTMRDVVSGLESALQLQESFEKLDHENLFPANTVAKARSGQASTSSTCSEGFKSGVGSVFSDILNPNAR